MLSPFNLLLLTAVLCVVMLFVLASLMRSGISGVREWTLANVLAFVALLLYAARGVAPPLLSIELANELLAGAITAVFIGFRRFFARTIPVKFLAAGLVLVAVGVAAFHYVVDSIAVRTVVVSAFHATVCFLIGLTILRSSALARPRYPYLFTGIAAILLAFGHCIRGLVYGVGWDALTHTFEATAWNLFFLSIGTIVLPILTMGAVMMVHDKMMAKAEDAANRDFLTGAWSRRAFFEFAERELLRARRSARPLSLLLFDVDYFKNINDTYGHAMGDLVLKDIVSRANCEIRGIDYVARIGGEEFAVLLPDAGHASAMIVGDRLRAVLERKIRISDSKHDAGSTATYSVSVGVATLQEHETLAGLMRRADSALYAAKAAGRNTVVSA